MSILDENIEEKTDKQALINAFINIEKRHVPFAMKAWIDVIMEYFDKPIPNEDKASILYILGLCKLNYRIYLRDLGSTTPILTCVSTWKNPKRNPDYIDSWVQYTLTCPNIQTKDVMHFLIGLVGIDNLTENISDCINGDRWVNDCYIWDMDSNIIDLSYLKPVTSNYHLYKQYIYQLLEMYNIKKESE